MRDAPIYACPRTAAATERRSGGEPCSVRRCGYSVSDRRPAPYDVTTGDDGVTARLTSGGVCCDCSASPPGARRPPGRRSTAGQEVPRGRRGRRTAQRDGRLSAGLQGGRQCRRARCLDHVRPAGDRDGAVKNDLALIAVAEGPFRRFSPDFAPGPPSAANLEIAMDMGNTSKASAGSAILPDEPSSRAYRPRGHCRYRRSRLHLDPDIGSGHRAITVYSASGSATGTSRSSRSSPPKPESQ